MRTAVVEEFAEAWQALGQHRPVQLKIRVPESPIGIRAHVWRVDEKPGAPEEVGLRLALFQLGSGEEVLGTLARDQDFEALIVCYAALTTLFDMAGARVSTRAWC